ncbi:LytTR family transcriptional regulator DNA-binding domain-containing protein [Mucilaginibacter sp. HD30]
MTLNNKLLIPQSDYLYLIDFHKIIFCKSENCYTTVYTVDGNNLLLVRSLAKVARDDLHAMNFIRVNQSYLINKDHIQAIDKKRKFINMSKDYSIPFTITLKELMELL